MSASPIVLITPSSHLTAFKPRPPSSSARSLPAVTFSDSFFKCHRQENVASYPLNGYQRWLDAGQLEPPARHDPGYDANLWRHFAREGTEDEGRPPRRSVRIPAPSRMNDSTYVKFIGNARGLHRDPVRLEHDIARATRQLEEMTRQQGSETAVMRVPPTDPHGRIFPPRQYRRLKAQGRIRHLPNRNYDSYPTAEDLKSKELLLTLPDRPTLHHHVKKRGITLWNLTYKKILPTYTEVH